jgi:hypothetical protein
MATLSTPCGRQFGMRQQADAEKDELYKQIGQLKVELDFPKKEPPYQLKTAAYGSIRTIRV